MKDSRMYRFLFLKMALCLVHIKHHTEFTMEIARVYAFLLHVFLNSFVMFLVVIFNILLLPIAEVILSLRI